MLRSCLGMLGLFLGVCLAATAWFFVYYPPSPPGTTPAIPPFEFRLAGAAGAGFATGIPLFLGLAGFMGVRTRLREREQTLTRAASVDEPKDGSVQPFVGRIVAAGETLVAPLSQRACVLYEYLATHRSTGKSSTDVEDAKGYALCSTRLDTGAGSFDIRAYLEPEFDAEPIDPDLARPRLAEHQRTASLYQVGFDLVRNYRESNAYLLDDDGEVRYDQGTPGGDAKSTRYVERILQDDDEVVIFGMYSASRHAIVPDPADEILHRARVRKGGIAVATRRLAREALWSGVFGAVCLVAAAAAAWATYTRVLPGLN